MTHCPLKNRLLPNTPARSSAVPSFRGWRAPLRQQRQGIGSAIFPVLYAGSNIITMILEQTPRQANATPAAPIEIVKIYFYHKHYNQ
jgi:hypothetical protein